MRKFILSTLTALAISAFAQNEEPNVMILHYNNGNSAKFKIENIDHLEFTKIEGDTDFEDAVNPDFIMDLSAPEMANCYIVRKAGTYKFKADNQFNLGEGLPVPPEIHPVSARLVWQSEMNSIKSVSFKGSDNDIPYIEFEVATAKGNALIAAVDENDVILWSWHIWMPLEDVSALPISTGYELMNMNLGALNNSPGEASSYGMLYQWGRKDPFPASATPTGDTTTIGAPLYDIDNNKVNISYSSWANTANNTMDYAIANPTVCLSNYSQYATSRDWLRSELSDDSLWGNPEGAFRDSETNTYPNKGQKTCYDPCPPGWRVAPADAFRDFTSSGGYAWVFEDFNVKDVNDDGEISLDDYNYGWCFNINDDTALYFPAAARYDGQYAMLMGSMSGLWGSYWSNAPYPSITGGAFCNLSFQTKSMTGQEMITISPSGGSSRADAYSIRCIKDN